MQALKLKMEKLKEEVACGSGWTQAQTTEKKSLMMNKENVYRNLDNVKSVLKATRAEVERVEGASEVLRQENKTDFDTIEKLEKEAAEKQAEAKAQKARKASLELNLHSLQDEVKSKRLVLTAKDNELKSEKVDIIHTEKKLREAKEQMEKYLREYDSLFRMTQKLTEDLEVQIHLNETLCTENNENTNVLEEKKVELKRIIKESGKVNAAKKVTNDKIALVETEKEGFEKERDELKLKIENLANIEIKAERKEGENLRNKFDEKKREKEILTRKVSDIFFYFFIYIFI